MGWFVGTWEDMNLGSIPNEYEHPITQNPNYEFCRECTVGQCIKRIFGLIASFPIRALNCLFCCIVLQSLEFILGPFYNLSLGMIFRSGVGDGVGR